MANLQRPTTALTQSSMDGSEGTDHTQPSSRRRLITPGTLNEEEEWSGEEEDPGMFSFLRPSTAISNAPNPLSLSPPFQQRTLDPNLLPRSNPLFPEGFSSSSSTLGTQSTPPGLANSLSPAAAYALAALHPSNLVESTESLPPPARIDGTRKRGTWQYPDSPTYQTDNPYSPEAFDSENRRIAELRYNDGPRVPGAPSERASTGYSSDGSKIGQKYWDERSANSSLVVDEAVRIRMKDMVLPDDYMMGDENLDNKSFEEDEDSPYPEVRASVSNIDDIEMPCLTFRSWFLGITFTLLLSAINAFFSFRYPAPVITPVIAQVISYPCGKLLAYTLPAKIFRVPKRLQRWGFEEDFSFNPGPFNIKEHTVIVIMANVAGGSAYALNFSVASQKFYNIHQGIGFDFLLLLTTQMVGFGMAGICRRYLVSPAAMIWPQNLVFCTLLNTLHAEDDDSSAGGMTRFRFLGYVAAGAFLWYFLPGFLFQALSVFSWVCWIAPNNVVVNQLFGLSSGLGMSALTFDWSQISYIGSPLIVPWWAEVNIFVGFVIAFWIVSPAMYYSNTWFTSYLPMSTSSIYDRFGKIYNTTRVSALGSGTLNTTAYAEYSPTYLPITYAGVYGIAFALAAAVLVHTALYHGRAIYQQLRSTQREEEEDIHTRLMRAYPEVPDWWYWIYIGIFGVMSIVTVAFYNVQLPVWGLVISLIIPFIYILPAGFVFAMTSQVVTLSVITEFIGGYLLPGRPLANMLFKVYTVASIGGGLSFIQDLKLGHYMKIPPRTTFLVQVIASICACFVQVGVKEMLLEIVPDLCDRRQAALLSCPTARVFYSSSILWGLIGPARLFGGTSVYKVLLYALPFGAVLPIPFWFFGRRYPNSWLKSVNIPVMLSGATLMPPATGINYSSWFLVGFIFQYWMRKHNYRFWSKFTFILSAGLDIGTIGSGLFIFFVLQLPLAGTINVDWWGNTVFENTLDWTGVAYRTLAKGEFFGPSSGW